MAAWGLASAPNIKVFSFYSELNKFRCNVLDAPYKMKCNRLLHRSKGTQICLEPLNAAGFERMALTFTKSLAVSCGLTSKKDDPEVMESDENKSIRSPIIPQSLQVEPLISTICDTTSIAEFKLEIAGFRLYVKRNLVDNNIPVPVPNLPPMQANTTSDTPDLNGSPATTSLAISKAKPSTDGIQRIVDTASDEGLVILQSPKVGFFRRSRTIKGKRAPPSCKEKQQVKEGQVVCYVEQLGGEIPIESDVSGEVIKILREDGEPVGYGDALIVILPSFPGIKLQ